MGRKRMKFGFAALCLLGLLCTGAAAEEATGEFRVELFQEGSLSAAMPQEDLAHISGTDELYQRIYQAMRNRESVVDISSAGLEMSPVGESQLQGAVMRVINENPRLFYVASSFSYTGSGSTISTLYLSYKDDIYGAEELEAFDRRVEEILAEAISPGMSKLDQVLALHDYLVLHCAYNRTVAEGGTPADKQVYNAYGALVAGDAVCNGYALGYKLLMNEIGVPCSMVTSSAMNHAWNIVALDGSWYHVDTTWDDPVPNAPGTSRHVYFLRTDDEFQNPPADARMTPHTNWIAPQACTDTTYSSGWAFRESELGFYWRDGSFYYVSDSSIKKGNLDLSETATVAANLNRAFYSNVQWKDGVLYYVKSTGRETSTGGEPCALAGYSLDTGKDLVLRKFVFERIWNGNSTSDCLGVELSADGRGVSAYSSMQYQTVAAADLLPAEWLARVDGDTALLGVQPEGRTLRVGAYLAKELAQDARLYVAWYKDGRMCAIGGATVKGAMGTQWIETPFYGASADRAAILLLTDDGKLTPLCLEGNWSPSGGAWSAQPLLPAA